MLCVVSLASFAFAAAAQSPQSTPQPAIADAAKPAPLQQASFRAYAAPGQQEIRVSEFSGLPVPRYASLRYDKVNGRSGPGSEYPVSWTYERLGLPVIIVRESEEWRKVRDPQGDEVWVLRNMLAGQRTAVATAMGAVRKEPQTWAPTVARYRIGAVLRLGECADGWCRVEARGLKGWAPQTELWGAAELAPPQ